jgi:hypothetical protein
MSAVLSLFHFWSTKPWVRIEMLLPDPYPDSMNPDPQQCFFGDGFHYYFCKHNCTGTVVVINPKLYTTQLQIIQIYLNKKFAKNKLKANLFNEITVSNEDSFDP